MQLPEATLAAYVGTYQLAPVFSIAITREGTQLFAQATGQSRLPIFAEKPDEFFLRVVDAQLTFTRDAAGAVAGVVLRQNGQATPGPKVQ